MQTCSQKNTSLHFWIGYSKLSEMASLSLTYERESWWQYGEHAVAVHGECDGKVHRQASQHEERVNCRPVGHLKPQLWAKTASRFYSYICFIINKETFEKLCKRKVSGYLDADGKQQTCLSEEGEGLVVGDVLPIIPHCVVHSSIGDKKEHQGAVAAVEGTFEEGLLAEVQVELTWNIELRMLETPHVIHILTSRGRQRH